MKRPHLAVLLAVLALWGGILLYDWGAHRGLITLDAKNQEVLPVLAEVSRQCGFPILSPTNTMAKVTVHFRRATLTDALNVLRDQTDGRWQKCFLIGRDASQLAALGKKLVETGPPMLITQMGGMGPGAGGTDTPPPAPAEFKVTDRDLRSASLMLALQARTSILVDDSLNSKVSLTAKSGDPFAIARKLARAAGARAQTVYLFQTPSSRRGFRMFGGGREGDRGGDRETLMEKIYAEQLPLLPPEEQEAIRTRHEEWQARRAEMATLTPEQRRAKMEEFANNPARLARMEQRSLGQIKNLTPEQRQQRNQRFAARAKRRGQAP